jgi:hypothetical protein
MQTRPLCPVPGCTQPLLPKRVVCYRCWAKIPRRLKWDINQSAPWKDGNEQLMAFFDTAVQAAIACISRQAPVRE